MKFNPFPMACLFKALALSIASTAAHAIPIPVPAGGRDLNGDGLKDAVLPNADGSILAGYFALGHPYFPVSEPPAVWLVSVLMFGVVAGLPGGSPDRRRR